MLGEEVEEDLHYATENGKTVAEVIGPDVRQFAKQYTAESLELESPKDRIVVSLIVVVLLLVIGVVMALRFMTYFDSLLPWYAVVVLSTVAAAAVMFWVGKSR